MTGHSEKRKHPIILYNLYPVKNSNVHLFAAIFVLLFSLIMVFSSRHVYYGVHYITLYLRRKMPKYFDYYTDTLNKLQSKINYGKDTKNK